MRQVGSLYVEEEAPLPSVPQEAPERFVVYLSGSDNLWAGVHLGPQRREHPGGGEHPGKAPVLLATPRDFYVSFSQTGGAMDKLTHAASTGWKPRWTPWRHCTGWTSPTTCG